MTMTRPTRSSTGVGDSGACARRVSLVTGLQHVFRIFEMLRTRSGVHRSALYQPICRIKRQLLNQGCFGLQHPCLPRPHALRTSHTLSSQSEGIKRITIQKLMMKTSHLEQAIPELEHYVRLHRDQFPEDTTIVQCLTFFRLKPEQLRRIGESPDVDAYGVRQLEILVIPYGCNVSE
ncbi:hypothetical protein NP493_7846g00002, partial [Ridgeia piscesae]